MFVYLLVCSDGSTYVGATVNLERRLRQHNGCIKGGAVYTTSKIKCGKSWTRHCYVEGFPEWRACLQFEWRWKQLTRKLSIGTPLEKRMNALNQLLSLDRSTTAAIPFSQWERAPIIKEN
jgi:predicted GIY-YIG superfamily endonuclease